MRSLFFLLSIFACTLVGSSYAMESTAQELPVVYSISSDILSVTKRATEKRIILYGHDLDTVLFDEGIEVKLGPFVASDLSGNAEEVAATFPLTTTSVAEPFVHNTEYTIEIYQYGQLLHRVDQHPVSVFNPYQLQSSSQHTKQFFRKTKRKKASKRTVGLNVHWALGSQESDQELYRKKVDNSDTQWVREFIDYDVVMGENSLGWIDKYDRVFREYEQRNMRVVVMLAYGTDDNGSDRYKPPSTTEWETFVRRVVRRYGVYVDAWEVWNEPDSPSYMHPNTVQTMHPLLKASYPLIKYHDPTSIVLNGAIGDIAHTDFIRKLYAKSGAYFDELSVHLYYCDEYLHNGNNGKLEEDLTQLYEAIPEHRRQEQIWVTELGCSLGVQYMTEQKQHQYLKKTTNELLNTGKFRPILLYDFRDRPYLGKYEANFGLMTQEGRNKPVWKWYRRLPQS